MLIRRRKSKHLEHYRRPWWTMFFCFHCAQHLSSRSASYSSSPLRFRHHHLIVLSSFLSVVTSVQGRRDPGPTFNVVTFSGLTPCNPVTFSWTGGLSPFSLVIYNYENDNTVQEFDGIEDSVFSWVPPQHVVGRSLYAEVVDDDDSYDDTDGFVVQSTSCSTAVPPAASTTATPIPPFPSTTPVSTHPPASPSSTSSANSPSVASYPPLSNTTAPSSPPGSLSSHPSQSLPRTSSTLQPGNSTRTTPALPTTGSVSETDGSTSSPSPFSTTSLGRSSPSRPHRTSSVSAGEIAGIVLGAVAILAMLVALIVWRWAARRRAPGRTPEDDNYTGTSCRPQLSYQIR